MRELEEAVERCKAKLSEFPGVFDIADDSRPGKWEFQLQVKEEARAMGVSSADLAETVRASYYGAEVMRLQRGRHEVKLMVRYPRDQRQSLADFEQIRVRTADGAERPLTELAKGTQLLCGGDRWITVPDAVAERFRPGDALAVVEATAEVLLIPAAERKRVANELRSTGAAEGEKIRADADRQREITIANAYRDAQKIKGEGDAEAARIYADAFGRDPQFAQFYRSLEAYRASIGKKGDVMVLDPSSSEFFKVFRGGAAGAAPAPKK